jgi:negative regulator of genetic competence, sporulation and motility
MKQENQTSLFDDFENEWQKEWKDMPEFISDDKKPVQQIIVSFRTHADVVEFAKRLGITVTAKTNSTWFPAKGWDTRDVYINDNWGKDEK